MKNILILSVEKELGIQLREAGNGDLNIPMSEIEEYTIIKKDGMTITEIATENEVVGYGVMACNGEVYMHLVPETDEEINR